MFSGALKASSGYLAKTSIVEGENSDNKLHVGCKNTEILFVESFLTKKSSYTYFSHFWRENVSLQKFTMLPI